VTAGWEPVAADWVAWARDSRDAYWEFRDVFFALVPEPGRRTLEIGSGEGRVSRGLAARGHRVVGLEPSETLRRAAAEADPDGEYVDGSAESLPFPDETFDLVVAYNSLMDVDEMRQAVREAARVLVPGGRLCACVTHPFTDAGRFASREPDALFVVRGSALEPGGYDETFERGDGLRMRFVSHTYPLGHYFAALEQAGLLVEAVREPASAEGRWSRVPNFLMWRAVKGG
jgi:SAM-dependent methyltransferase